MSDAFFLNLAILHDAISQVNLLQQITRALARPAPRKLHRRRGHRRPRANPGLHHLHAVLRDAAEKREPDLLAHIPVIANPQTTPHTTHHTNPNHDLPSSPYSFRSKSRTHSGHCNNSKQTTPPTTKTHATTCLSRRIHPVVNLAHISSLQNPIAHNTTHKPTPGLAFLALFIPR